MNLPENKTYKTKAVFDEKAFKHFNINPDFCSMWGAKKEDIVDVNMYIHEDQTLPTNKLVPELVDYWGWWDGERFSMIYAQYFILNMCFPYGMKSEEESGKGKAYRLNVTQVS